MYGYGYDAGHFDSGFYGYGGWYDRQRSMGETETTQSFSVIDISHGKAMLLLDRRNVHSIEGLHYRRHSISESYEIPIPYDQNPLREAWLYKAAGIEFMKDSSLFFLWYSCGIPGGELDWAVCLLTSPDARSWTSAEKTVLTLQTSNVVLPLGRLQPNLPIITTRNGQLVLSFSTIPFHSMPAIVHEGRPHIGGSYEGRVMLIYTSSNALDWRQIPSTLLFKDVCSVAYDPHTDLWLWSLRAGSSMHMIVCLRVCIAMCMLVCL